MEIQSHNIHNRFQLNGFHFDREGLLQVAYSFVKEGEPYEWAIGRFLMDWMDDNDYIEAKTSGSTGEPKHIRLSKQSMVDSALATGDFFNVTVGDSALMCVSAEYIAGKMMLVRAFILGLDLYIVEPSSAPLAYDGRDYDFCAMVPLQAETSLKELHRIKTLLVGGAKISDKLKEKLKAIDSNIYETFGMTESITHFAAKDLRNDTYFRTLPGVEIRTDEHGCLHVRAPWLGEELTGNDVVRLVSDTEFDWLGRRDNVINSGGIKLFPEQIASLIDAKINRRFFVAGLPDDRLGEKVVLIIEGAPCELDKNIFEPLSNFQTPKETHFIPKFEETYSGKIIRKDTLQKLSL